MKNNDNNNQTEVAVHGCVHNKQFQCRDKYERQQKKSAVSMKNRFRVIDSIQQRVGVLSAHKLRFLGKVTMMELRSTSSTQTNLSNNLPNVHGNNEPWLVPKLFAIRVER